MNIKQLEAKKLEIEKKIVELKVKEDKFKTEYITTSYKGKEFRIYPWSEPVKDFIIPKGFRIAEEKEFIDLYDSGFKIEEYPVIYFTKNRSKLNIKNGWSLSWLFLGRYLYLNSNVGNLALSCDYGRVVVVKVKS